MNQYSPQGFKVLPTIVKNLIIINVIFYFATVVFQHSLGVDLTDYLGLYFFKSENFHFFQYISVSCGRKKYCILVVYSITFQSFL